MIDVSEIDLDKLTTLELWELHYRIAARLDGWKFNTERHECLCRADESSYNSVGAHARMRSLV